MAENPDRFVIIDGVQVSRERAKRKGLLDADGNVRNSTPNESRARTESSARRGSGGERSAPVTATAQVGDGAVSTGEDAARAGASATGTADVGSSDAAAASVAATGGDDASASDAGSSDDGAASSDDASSSAAADKGAKPIRRR